MVAQHWLHFKCDVTTNIERNIVDSQFKGSEAPAI